MTQRIPQALASIRRHRQAGVAYVWVIVSITAIVGVIALVVDLARLQVNRQEQYYAARSLATAALFSLSREPDASQRDAVMLARVEELAAQLKVLGDGAFSGQGDVYITEDAVDPSSGGINVTPGFWVTSPPSTPSDLACDAYPCFKPRQGSTDVPTALRVSVTSRESSPVRSTFAHFFGTDTFRTRDEAVVALLPRRLIMAVDLSRSMQADSHAMLGPDQSEYAYWINTVNGGAPVAASCGSNASGATNICRAASFCLTPPCTTQCVMKSPNGESGIFNMSYNYSMASDAGGERLPDSTHIHADYSCFLTRPPLTGWSTANAPGSFLIDMKSDPVPLSTALRSLDKALTAMEQSSVVGDQAGLLGFDTDAGLLVSGSTIGRKHGPYLPHTNDFEILKKITHYENGPGEEPKFDQYNYERIKQGFFPIPRSDAVYTNVPDALLKAREMLASTASGANISSLPGRNYIVIATDGITNCYQNINKTAYCSNLLADYTTSRNVAQQVISDLQAEGVKLVFMLFGQSGPHTLLIPKGDGSPDCFTDQEARDRGYDYVDPSPVNGSAQQEFNGAQLGQNYFYDPNSFYKTIAPSGGIWVPIRPCYRGPDGNCVNLFDWANAPADRNTCEKLANSDIPVKKDGKARLTFDPYGRTPEEQAFDAIDSIMQDVNITTVPNVRY